MGQQRIEQKAGMGNAYWTECMDAVMVDWVMLGNGDGVMRIYL